MTPKFSYVLPQISSKIGLRGVILLQIVQNLRRNGVQNNVRSEAGLQTIITVYLPLTITNTNDAYLAISELRHILHAEVLLLVAEANDLHKVCDLLILHDLLLRGLPCVQKLTL